MIVSRSLSPSANTLVEAPTSCEETESAVFDVLDRSEATNLLVLSYRDSPDAWLRNWQATVGDLPEEVGFVHVGVKTRSTSAAPGSPIPTSLASTSSPSPPSSSSPSPDSGLGGTVVPLADAVSDPTDLARLGVCASEYMEAWEGNDRETVVFLDSLTQLLEHVDLSRAFSFLHVLAGRIESVDGRGYYLLDPSAHDDESLGVVRELADAVVNVAPDCSDADSPDLE